MSEFDGDDGIQCSANSRRWECLIYVTELLSEEKIALDQFANKVEKPFDTSSNSPILGFRNMGKRSPRNKKVDITQSESLDAAGRTQGKRSNLKKFADALTIEKAQSKKLSRTSIDRQKKVDASKKRTKKIRDPPSDLPEALKKCILDREYDLESVVLVTEKILTMTDVSKLHGKLSVRYSQVRNKFLKPSEVDDLDKDKGQIKAILIQPCLEECQIRLRNWKSNLEYALIQDWNEVCRRNALSQGVKIQLWSFRRNLDHHLCFALAKVV